MNMDNDALIKLIRENERMKTALKNISTYCERAIMGGWRQPIYDMAQDAMGNERTQ